MNRSTLFAQVAIGTAIGLVALVAGFRLLEWLFAGSVALWLAFLFLPLLMAAGTVAIDIESERRTSDD